MHRVSPTFLAALRESHTVAVRVDAYQGARCVLPDVPITDGTVTVTSGTGVHRKLDVTIADPALWDRLAPIGTELKVWRGIAYPGGSREMVPLGVFSLDQQSTAIVAKGAITVSSAPDRWARVQRGRFETPRTSEHALTAVTSIVNLVSEVAPTSPELGGVSSLNPLSGVATQLQVWDRDRDAAIAGLCTQAGVEAFFGPLGNLVIRDVPTLARAPQWRVHAGRDGVMVGGTATRDRTRVYNVIVVVSSRTDGTAPFAPQIVEDNDPTSVTNVNGPYGRSPYFLISGTLTSAADARAAGRALLVRTRGRFVDLAVEGIVNPALETGDTVSSTGVDGNPRLDLLDGFTVPLTAEGKQSLTLRTLAAVSGDTSG